MKTNMNATDEIADLRNKYLPKSKDYFLDVALGPGIAAILERFVIQDPSEQLVAFIYFLGFSLSAFKLWVSVKHRKLDFLEKMVYREQKKNGEEMKGGIVDSNSVGVTEWISRI